MPYPRSILILRVAKIFHIKVLLKNGNHEMKNIYHSYLINIKLNWLDLAQNCQRNP